MKKLLILLLAILAIAAVAYFCIYEKSIPTIEKDLSFRSQNQLNSNEMSWARVKVDGRNITLTGVAPSEKMRDAAQRIAHVDGVHLVSNELTLAAVSPNTADSVRALVANTSTDHNDDNNDYHLSIAKNASGKLLVDGVMSAEMHQKVMTKATADMGVDQLIDRITDKEDVESPEELPAIATIMLNRVAGLEDGRASLTGKKLLVSGSSPTEEAIEQIKRQTAKGLPEGFESRFDLTPPTAVVVATSATPKSKQGTQVATLSSDTCQQKFNEILADSNIVFNVSSAVIRKSSYKVLGQLANVASQCSSYNINVHGHTDATGRNQLNQKLSKKRAQTVANYLAEKGVNPKHVHAIGHGSSKPIASNKTPAGRARNRRIELTVED